MSRFTKQHFIDETCKILQEQGRTDFTLKELLASCKAHKGSLYHFFPNGKNELVVAAVNYMADCAEAHVQQCFNSERSVADAVRRQLSELSKWVELSGPRAIPFSAIAAKTGDDDEEVTLACLQALKKLESLYAKRLQFEGMKASDAKLLASFIVNSTEGAFLVSRIRRSSQPLNSAAKSLRTFIMNHLESDSYSD